jgi:hypothetical protein
MSAPTYQWICLNCAATTPAGQDTCASYGFPATASVADLEAFRAGKPLPSNEPWLRPLLTKTKRAIHSFAQLPPLQKSRVVHWTLAAITPFLTLALVVQETHHDHYGPAPWVIMVSIAFIGWLCATPALFISGFFCLLAERAKEKGRDTARDIYVVLAGIFTLLSILFAGLLIALIVTD